MSKLFLSLVLLFVTFSSAYAVPGSGVRGFGYFNATFCGSGVSG